MVDVHKAVIQDIREINVNKRVMTAHMDLVVTTTAAISALNLQTFVTALMDIVTGDVSQDTEHHYALKVRVRARQPEIGLELDQDGNDQDPIDFPQLPHAFVYDLNSFQFLCYIGELTTQCTHCLTFKIPNETPGRLRADTYSEFRAAISNQDNADPTNLGQRIILPSSYTGGLRYMFEKRQDFRCYVRQYGRPDLFITITRNPKWPEITDNLLENQQPHDRPGLIVRVFKQKLNKAMTLMKSGCFGTLQAWLYPIEFQKRGSSHANALLWLKQDAKIQPDLIDRVVCAEIPNKEQDKELHSIVTTQMIHEPCGHLNPTSPCMKDGRCSKKFSMSFQPQTEVVNDSYPKYRRRSPENDGNSAAKNVNQTDNRWVVLCNPWLLRQLNCHVNMEICSSIQNIKYVLKYVHKEVDKATFQLQHENQRDEISNFISARFIGSTEAAWHIYKFPLMERHPAVVQLAVHLENGQRVYFNEDTVMNVATAPPPATTLIAFSICVGVEILHKRCCTSVCGYSNLLHMEFYVKVLEQTQKRIKGRGEWT
ncbi:DNA helicase [Plakobranchus ocellatus]|uniref:DNA helicase n=1 Tax=Plakobranchus ocellatus TaxID=259542 RepID=A0AAV4BB13_9GAST|nr:DNA helicase [Plakobranchus ocellatus]